MYGSYEHRSMPIAPTRGEVWSAELTPGNGQLVVIVQNETAEIVGTTIIVPLIEDPSKVGIATNVSIPAEEESGISRPCVAICPLLRAVPIRRLRVREGRLSREKLSEIEQRVAFLLGLPG